MAEPYSIVAGAVLGGALVRANSCTVAATQRLVEGGRTDWLVGILIVIGWAGVTLSSVALALPGLVEMPPDFVLAWNAVAGGVVLGLGAAVNRGCFLGSLAQFARGHLGYGLTLVGIGAAMAILATGWFSSWAPDAVPRTDPGLGQATSMSANFAIFLLPSLYGAWRWWRRRSATLLALIFVGISGGAIYACNPAWSYAGSFFRLSQSRPSLSSISAEAPAIALLLGALASAMTAHRFNLQVPRWRAAPAHLGGGFLMAVGAQIIPGGNDTLMLWAIPGLTLYGVTAYAAMIVTIAALLMARRASGARRSLA